MTAVHLSKRKKTSRGIGYDLKKDWQLWIMLLPAIVYIFLFCYMPMYGAQLAFRKYDFTRGIYGGEWVGFKYFSDYFNSAMFSTTLRNTFVISLCSIVFGFPAPIVLAIIINQIKNSKWKRTLQTTVYIPYFISVVVLVSMLNVLFAKSGGVLSDFMKSLGIVPQNANLLGQKQYFVWMYVGSGIWANAWQRVIHIEFPVLVPTIMILLIMNMGSILNVGFDKVFLMQNTLNKQSSEVISTYVYHLMAPTTGAPQFSLATAVGLFTNVVNFAFLIATNYISKRVTGSGLM